jgi:hypothetical protein
VLSPDDKDEDEDEALRRRMQKGKARAEVDECIEKNLRAMMDVDNDTFRSPSILLLFEPN